MQGDQGPPASSSASTAPSLRSSASSTTTAPLTSSSSSNPAGSSSLHSSRPTTPPGSSSRPSTAPGNSNSASNSSSPSVSSSPATSHDEGGGGGVSEIGASVGAGLAGLNKMFQSLGAELEKTVLSVTKDLSREKDLVLAWRREVENAAKALEDEKQLMQERVGTMEEIIDLNVGGQCFTTTRTTLCSVKGSMLEAMFSGRWQLPTDKKGRYFIDRNPKHFERILDFLREPSREMVLPKNKRKLEYLKRELEYYGLSESVLSTASLIVDAEWEPMASRVQYGTFYDVVNNGKTAIKARDNATIGILREKHARNTTTGITLAYKIRIDALSAFDEYDAIGFANVNYGFDWCSLYKQGSVRIQANGNVQVDGNTSAGVIPPLSPNTELRIELNCATKEFVVTVGTAKSFSIVWPSCGADVYFSIAFRKIGTQISFLSA